MTKSIKRTCYESSTIYATLINKDKLYKAFAESVRHDDALKFVGVKVNDVQEGFK